MSDTLQKLEMAMKFKKYQLYVERQSASLGILEVLQIYSNNKRNLLTNYYFSLRKFRMEQKFSADYII